MKSIADKLPPEIARQLHPGRRKNERATGLSATNSSISTAMGFDAGMKRRQS